MRVVYLRFVSVIPPPPPPRPPLHHLYQIYWTRLFTLDLNYHQRVYFPYALVFLLLLQIVIVYKVHLLLYSSNVVIRSVRRIGGVNRRNAWNTINILLFNIMFIHYSSASGSVS